MIKDQIAPRHVVAGKELDAERIVAVRGASTRHDATDKDERRRVKARITLWIRVDVILLALAGDKRGLFDQFAHRCALGRLAHFNEAARQRDASRMVLRVQTSSNKASKPKAISNTTQLFFESTQFCCQDIRLLCVATFF